MVIRDYLLSPNNNVKGLKYVLDKSAIFQLSSMLTVMKNRFRRASLGAKGLKIVHEAMSGPWWAVEDFA
jgi:hypothetical protein